MLNIYKDNQSEQVLKLCKRLAKQEQQNIDVMLRLLHVIYYTHQINTSACEVTTMTWTAEQSRADVMPLLLIQQQQQQLLLLQLLLHVIYYTHQMKTSACEVTTMT